MKLGHVATQTALRRMALALGLLSLAACHIVEPIQNFADQPVPESDRKFPLAQIAAQIRAAGEPLGWIFTDAGPGKMIGTIKERSATVEVVYSQTSYSITLVSSVHLYQKDGEIIARYNVWSRNLNAAIVRQLAAAGAYSS
jgi:hypothetical protein